MRRYALYGLTALFAILGLASTYPIIILVGWASGYGGPLIGPLICLLLISFPVSCFYACHKANVANNLDYFLWPLSSGLIIDIFFYLPRGEHIFLFFIDIL